VSIAPPGRNNEVGFVKTRQATRKMQAKLCVISRSGNFEESAKFCGKYSGIEI